MNSEKAAKILIIDDEELVRINLADYLEDDGFVVKSVSSGEEAIALLCKEHFDVAIVDIRLPGIDGNLFILEAYKLQPDLRYLVHTGSPIYSLPPEITHLGISHVHVFQKPLYDMGVISTKIMDLMQEVNARE